MFTYGSLRRYIPFRIRKGTKPISGNREQFHLGLGKAQSQSQGTGNSEAS